MLLSIPHHLRVYTLHANDQVFKLTQIPESFEKKLTDDIMLTLRMVSPTKATYLKDCGAIIKYLNFEILRLATSHMNTIVDWVDSNWNNIEGSRRLNIEGSRRLKHQHVRRILTRQFKSKLNCFAFAMDYLIQLIRQMTNSEDKLAAWRDDLSQEMETTFMQIFYLTHVRARS